MLSLRHTWYRCRYATSRATRRFSQRARRSLTRMLVARRTACPCVRMMAESADVCARMDASSASNRRSGTLRCVGGARRRRTAATTCMGVRDAWCHAPQMSSARQSGHVVLCARNHCTAHSAWNVWSQSSVTGARWSRASMQMTQTSADITTGASDRNDRDR